jgi:hypothetical protein
VSERKLKSRKRRFSKGRRIAISDFTFAELSKQLHGRSWDAFMRRMFGLPDRKGREQQLVEGMLEVTTGTFILRLADTTWEEVELTANKFAEVAARKKQLRTYAPAIRMREVR